MLAATLAEAPAGPAVAVAAPDGFDPLAAREHIRNGGFDSGTDHWWRGGQTANLRVDAGRGCVDVAGNTAQLWDALLGQSGISLDEGRSYTLAFDASASAAATIQAQVQMEVEPFPATLSQCPDNVSLLDDGSAVPTAWWQLRDEHSAGEAQYNVGYGQRECTPAIGDWNGGGRTGVGVACRDSSGQWRCELRDQLSGGTPTITPYLSGSTGCRPPLRLQPYRMKGTP